MSLTVVSSSGDHNKQTVIVEGSTFETVSSMDARKLAISHAAGKGVTNPGVGLTASPYPVDGDGNMVGNPLKDGTKRAAKFRCDYEVTGGV